MKLPALALVLAAIIVGCGAINRCSVDRLVDAFNEMKRVGCINCDKYFHCIGNYNAVFACSGTLQVTTAILVSTGREFINGFTNSGDFADWKADEEANSYGRSGGNCANRYLKAWNCAYNPSTRQCKW